MAESAASWVAIFWVTMKISDHVRAQAIADYLRGDMTQAEVCAAFEARTGCRLSPRTLRSWLASLGPGPMLSAHARDRLVRALRQVRVLQAEIEAVIAELDEPPATIVPADLDGPAPGALPPAAGPAPLEPGPSETTTAPAAASLPVAEKETSTTRTPDRYDFWS